MCNLKFNKTNLWTMLRVSFWAFWYIYCLLSKTGPDACRETRETGVQFFLPCGWVWGQIKGKGGPFAPIKIGHVAIAKKKKKKIIFFIKSPNLLSLSSENFSSSLSSLHVTFLPSSSPPLLPPLKLQIPLHLPQIARKRYFRSLGAYLYFVGL